MIDSTPVSPTAAWYSIQRNRRRRKNALDASVIGEIADMPQDMIGQFRANTLELSVGDPIEIWPDMSGNAFDAWQSDASSQPALQSATFAGKTFQVARFDNVDDGMMTP